MSMKFLSSNRFKKVLNVLYETKFKALKTFSNDCPEDCLKDCPKALRKDCQKAYSKHCPKACVNLV